MYVKKFSYQPSTWDIFLIAICTIFGLQLMRNLFPYITYLLGDRLGWSTIALGLFALLVFLIAFLADPFTRFFGANPAFFIVAIGIGISRLAVQFWRFDPIGDLILATTGVISFLLFLALSLGISHRSGEGASLNFAVGMIVGFFFDLILNGAFLSYDLSWQSGWLPMLVIIILVAAQFIAVGRKLNTNLPAETADAVMSKAKNWLFIGPYFFLQLLFFSNIAWLSSNSNLSFSAAFIVLIISQVIAIAVLLLPTDKLRLLYTVAIGLSLIFTIIFLLTEFQPSWITIIFVILGQIGLTGLLIMVVREISVGRRLRGLRNISIIHGSGMILFVVLMFGYYAGFDISLPFPNTIVPLAAFLIIFISAWPLLGLNTTFSGIDFSNLRPLIIALGLFLIVPLVQWITWPQAEPQNLNGEPVRVMTYNLHNGIDPLGHLGLEAIAQVIEREDADVVGLQEVSRGWVINGSADMVTWLSRRLGMTVLSGPTADNQWGNAILTRLPVMQHENHPLPTEDLPINRGYMFTELDRGNGQPLYFMNTHFHHLPDGSDIRLQQSIDLLGTWNERPSTIIVGDLNAEHNTPEIDIFLQAGLSDVLDINDIQPGYTYPATGPERRIDYIWVTDDLTPSDANIPLFRASDHLAVGVTIE